MRHCFLHKFSHQLERSVTNVVNFELLAPNATAVGSTICYQSVLDINDTNESGRMCSFTVHTVGILEKD
jgi:hypothetical protein